jgi:hypothetical protein
MDMIITHERRKKKSESPTVGIKKLTHKYLDLRFEHFETCDEDVGFLWSLSSLIITNVSNY